MVEGHFGGPEGSKAVRFSGDEFRLVVKTFDDTSRDLLLRPKPVE